MVPNEADINVVETQTDMWISGISAAMQKSKLERDDVLKQRKLERHCASAGWKMQWL